MYTKFVVGNKEKVMTFKNKKPKSVYSEGLFRVPSWAYDNVIHFKNNNGHIVEESMCGWSVEDIAKNSDVSSEIETIKLEFNQVGLIYKENQLSHILGSGKSFYFWAQPETGEEARELQLIDVEKTPYLSDDLLKIMLTKKYSVYGDMLQNWNLVSLSQNEIAMIYKDKHLVDVKSEEQFGIWQTLYKYEVVKINTNELIDADYASNQHWLKNDRAKEMLTQVQTLDRQVAVISLNNKVKKVLGPNEEVLMFNQNKNWSVELISIDEDITVAPNIVDKLKKSNLLNTYCQSEMVANQHKALVFINGEVYKSLNSGEYAFWKFNQDISIISVDLKWQDVDVSGQEILTKDRVSIRVNLNAQYRIVDIDKVINDYSEYQTFIYKVFQLALREVVGTRSLDDLLTEKDKINSLLISQVRQKISNTGLELGEIGIKDIILPGEMKDILNHVVLAQKTAEANNIRRREETAQTRSLQNTAKMMEGNEVLYRLKELETLEKVVEKVGQLNVYGGLEQLMTGLLPSAKPSEKVSA